MRLRAAVLLAAVSLLANAGGLRAQVPGPEVHPGDRIRLMMQADLGMGESDWQYGLLHELSEDSLVVEGDDMAGRLPLNAVRRLEVARGERTYTALGAVLGVGTGVGIGALLSGYDSVADREELIIGAVGGGIVGALIGNQVRSDRWISVSLSSRLEVSVQPGNGYQLVLNLN